jgi:chorismate mutase
VSDRPQSIEELRLRIGENDRAIVASVNERLRLVRELWRLKAEQGTERLDLDRELRLREELHASNDGPLTPEGLERIVTELLDLTKRELDD